MAGPHSPFPLRYLDEAIGFLVPRSQVSFLKTRNSLNLISTERGGTKNPLKITDHAQGTVLGLPGTGVLRAFRISVTPKKFLQVRWDASPNPHYYTRGTRLRVCLAVLGQPVFRSILTWVPT